MVNCAVPACKNDSRRQTKQNSNVTFHRFPKNEELLKKWVDALQRADWEPTIRSFVCSAHFADSAMYFSKSGLRKLVQDAVPQHSLDNEQQQPKSRRKGKSKIIMPYMYVSRSHSPDTTRKKKKSEFPLDSIKKERTEAKKKSDAYTPDANDSPVKRKLKKRIMNLTKLSKRRRLRCNALYASLNRIRKKVTGITRSLKDLQEKISVNEELGRALEASGVSPTDLFQGLKKERSYSPDLQEEEEFFYSEIPNDIESYVEKSPKNKKTPIMVYTTSVPSLVSGDPGDCGDAGDLEVQVSVVKTESCPEELPKPLFVDMSAVCRVCLLSTASLHCIAPHLRESYEALAGAKLELSPGPDALCRGCIAALQRCQRFADMSRKAERYHNQEAATDSRDE